MSQPPPPPPPAPLTSSTSFPSRRNSRNLLLLSTQTPPLPIASNSSNNNAPLRSPRGVPRLSLLRESTVTVLPDGPPRYYLLGTRLDSRIPTWNRMYPGRVAAVNLDGTLQVCYDDGDLRDGVSLGNVSFESRQSTLSEHPATCPLHVGSQVEYMLEQAAWIPAKVTEVVSNNGDVFHLALCNGRTANNVARNQIRCYIPVIQTLRAHDMVEVLFPESKTWALCKVDDTLQSVVVTETNARFRITDVELRFPIPYVAPTLQQDEEEFLDATPMLLSMQERISQSIEVGAQVLITDKNGGALPKNGKADSAQVSIINFPLPADGLIETITFRLFESPADNSNQFEVILFDREPLPTAAPAARGSGAGALNRLAASDSVDESSPQLGPLMSPTAPPPPPKLYVSPDLPYRVSRSYIAIDPNSRQVQCCKLVVPLRGSAGQYLGIMNRKGRLNIAYTPDKKKPGESWSEKSVEVFYLMPRMVPKSFVGGPYTAREWHGRAGWFATLLVSDPVDAVDPAFQRRCELHALSKAGGATELARLCWLLTSLLKTRGAGFANKLLYETPALVRALRVLCQVNDSVVELVANLCSMAIVLDKPPNSLVKLQNALRFKATEMQIVQQGRHTIGGVATSFQGLLRCLLVMKRLMVESTPTTATAAKLSTVRVTLPPQPATVSLPLIRYKLKRNGSLVVSSSSAVPLALESGEYELILPTAAHTDDEDEIAFQTMLQTSGPILSTTELYFPAKQNKLKHLWALWTSPVSLQFRVDGNVIPSGTKSGDWLEDLERCTLLLHAFARRDQHDAIEQLPKQFIRDQYLEWRKRKDRCTVALLSDTTAGMGETQIVVPGASRIRLEWVRPPQLDNMTISVINQQGHSLSGRNGLPPAIECIEGDMFKVKLVAQRPAFDPEVVLKKSLEFERLDFPLAMGLSNCLGEPAKIRASGGELHIACSKCGPPGCRVEVICNIEGRPVTLHRSRFSCSACETHASPCMACDLFPDSLAARKSIRVRPKASFESVDKYEQFMKRVLLPGVPVRIAGSSTRLEPRKFDVYDAQTNQCWLRGITHTAFAFSDLELVPSSVPEPPHVQTPTTPTPPPPQANQPSSMLLLPDEHMTNGQKPGTFALQDIGPDIEITDHALTCTRLRSVGWGTQRFATYLDCGVTTISFRIVRNSSNHLFFGVVSPQFAQNWSKRMVESGSWSIRRDGSLHADGHEYRSSESEESQPINGEDLTMVIDMSTSERTVAFFANQGRQLLGKIPNIPAKVVPAVSFGGSNQVVSIASYSHVCTSAGRATTPTPSAVTSGDYGAIEITPEFDDVDVVDENNYLRTASVSWTAEQDRLLVCHIDHIAHDQRWPLSQILASSNASRTTTGVVAISDLVFESRFSSRFLQLLLEEQRLESVKQRIEWILAFNRSISQALPLLDLSFTEAESVAKDLSECAYLLLDALKRPMWEEALESTRTEEGQFEVVLDYGKALAHRDFVDVHGRFTVFAQAFRAMNVLPSSRLRGKGQLYRATLRGMRAHDDGGPYRQSMATYCEELMSIPGVGLFLPCANRTNEIAVNRDRWLPNPGASSALQFQMFEFVGKLMGIALRNREFLNLRLPSMVWKWLVNRKPTFEDLRAVDLLFANRVAELLEDDIVEEDEDSMMNFTCYSLDGRVIELVPGGAERVLENTVQDRHEWARLATEYKLNEFNAQLEAIRRGLHSVVPQRMLVLFQVEELELMVCGRPQIDLQLLREMTVYAGCTVHDAHIAYFWNVLSSFTQEQRSLYLKFVFGRATLPSKEAWGAPHKISSFEPRNAADTDSLLPRSHTCYFALDLPKYSSEEVLRRKLLFAIENCTEIDADQTTTGNRSAALGFDLNVDVNDLVSAAEEDDERERQRRNDQSLSLLDQQPAVHRSVSPSVALVNSFGSFSSRVSSSHSSLGSDDEFDEDEEDDDYLDDPAICFTTDSEFHVHNMDTNVNFGQPIDFEQ